MNIISSMKKSFITFFALAIASIPGMLYASPTKESKSVRDIIFGTMPLIIQEIWRLIS